MTIETIPFHRAIGPAIEAINPATYGSEDGRIFALYTGISFVVATAFPEDKMTKQECCALIFAIKEQALSLDVCDQEWLILGSTRATQLLNHSRGRRTSLEAQEGVPFHDVLLKNLGTLGVAAGKLPVMQGHAAAALRFVVELVMTHGAHIPDRPLSDVVRAFKGALGREFGPLEPDWVKPFVELGDASEVEALVSESRIGWAVK